MPRVVALVAALILLAGCQNTMDVLAGTTHACGLLHVEGYFTDTQGEVTLIKAPADWTPAQVNEFCPTGK